MTPSVDSGESNKSCITWRFNAQTQLVLFVADLYNSYYIKCIVSADTAICRRLSMCCMVIGTLQCCFVRKTFAKFLIIHYLIIQSGANDIKQTQYGQIVEEIFSSNVSKILKKRPSMFSLNSRTLLIGNFKICS